jgi:protein-S-isoprenylcysteine O-methyltransferase Ste14
MVVNAYFIATVRIQDDRGQQVISHGPYAFVRHPGYFGTILMNLAVPFLLNSLWALIPALGVAAVLIVRTYLEDEILQEELPGYKEYTQKVHFRLFPGIW